eukprot:gene17568-biopygen817
MDFIASGVEAAPRHLPGAQVPRDVCHMSSGWLGTRPPQRGVYNANEEELPASEDGSSQRTHAISCSHDDVLNAATPALEGKFQCPFASADVALACARGRYIPYKGRQQEHMKDLRNVLRRHPPRRDARAPTAG